MRGLMVEESLCRDQVVSCSRWRKGADTVVAQLTLPWVLFKITVWRCQGFWAPL